jgi:gluconate 2-dehydrogenase gamma chain
MTPTRRTFITSAAGAGAAFLVADWALMNEALAHAAHAVTQNPPPPFTTLSAAEAREIDAITQRIMPTTNTPGAKEAGVIYFIDKAVGTHAKEWLPDLRKGLADLAQRAGKKRRGATSFASLPVADQDAILIDIEKTDFFGAIRFGTMAGMFADPKWGGNRNHAGWKVINFDPQPMYQPPFGYYDAQLVRGKKA